MLSRLLKLVAVFAMSAGFLAACSENIAKSARDDRSRVLPDGGIEDPEAPTSTGGPPTCTGATQAGTDLQPVYVLMVVDGSRSMGFDEYGTPSAKWPAVVGSISAIVDGLAAQPDPTVAIGLMGFADSKDPGNADPNGVYGPYPNDGVDVPIGFVDAAQAAKIKERLNTTPTGITPTQPALQGAYKWMHAFQPQKPLDPLGKKVVVLITDGFPLSSIPTDVQIANSLAMAQNEVNNTDSILTFAVGVGDFPGDGVEYDPSFVGRLAVAGGTRRTPTCNPLENADPNNVCYFQVTPRQKTVEELRTDSIQAINAIRGQAMACDFVIKAPPEGFALDTHTVTVTQKLANGQTVTLLPDRANGWTFDDLQHPTKVSLHGSACDQFKQAGGKVDVVLGCK